MKKHILYSTLLSLSAMGMADDNVSGTLMIAPDPVEATMHVSLNNAVSYVAFTVDIALPEGWTVTSAQPVGTTRLEGDGTVNLSAFGGTETESTRFELSYSMIDENLLRVIGYNLGNKPIKATAGEIFTVTLTTQSLPNYADWNASLRDVHFIAANDIKTALPMAVDGTEGRAACYVEAKNFLGDGHDLVLDIDNESRLSTAETIELVDANNITLQLSFASTSTSAPTYRRTGIKNQWGTIVVPFDITIDDAQPYDFYRISDISENGDIEVEKITQMLPAGTPALIRINSAEVEGKTYDLTLEAATDNALGGGYTVNTTGSLTDGGTNVLTMVGKYQKVNVAEEEGFFISNNQFWNIREQHEKNPNSKINIGAFRAYLSGTLPQGGSTLRIGVSEMEEEETAIEALNDLLSGEAEYYDLEGRRLNDLETGKNIVKRGARTSVIIIK